MYDRTLKAKRDWNNMLSYAKEQAEEKGVEKGKMEGIDIGIDIGMVKGIEKRNVEIAQALFSEGFSIDKIATITGLTMEQLQTIQPK
jgi:predicted transposase/invertase (TIGR01784 family)